MKIVIILINAYNLFEHIYHRLRAVLLKLWYMFYCVQRALIIGRNIWCVNRADRLSCSNRTKHTQNTLYLQYHDKTCIFFLSLVSIIKILNFCKMLHKNKSTHRKWWWYGVVSTMATMQYIAFKMSICVYVWTGFDTYDTYAIHTHTHVARLCNLIDHNIDQVYEKIQLTIHSYMHIILCVLALQTLFNFNKRI